jgi:hypothetical protein
MAKQVSKVDTLNLVLNNLWVGFYLSHKTPGYCWRTPKCRNVCIPHACLEGKNAWETDARKSTSRTLK